jgi:uncharacterized protein (TIGR00299 family) protein
VIGYLDMPSGISGDMLLGCLVDAGWPVESLRDTIRCLGLPHESWAIDSSEVMRGPLRATLVDVRTPEQQGHGRHLSDIRRIIEGAPLPDEVITASIATFQHLAEAEAQVHGATVESVHFHEVGAVDAIVDIVGAAAGLHALGIDGLHASALPLGPGWASTAHGRIPLPAPATLALLARAGAPTRPAPGPGELVTPTGAALVATHATFGQPVMRIDRIGIGAGQSEREWPNVARLWLGQGEAGHVVEIETNIDDMNPQLYASVCEHLFARGALDVWLTPVQMKKGRPGVVVRVLAPASREQDLSDLLLRETTTLGVRVHDVRRHEAARSHRTVDTRFGPIAVKAKLLDGQLVSATPEHDDCRRIADRLGVPLRAVLDAATAAIEMDLSP